MFRPNTLETDLKKSPPTKGCFSDRGPWKPTRIGRKKPSPATLFTYWWCHNSLISTSELKSFCDVYGCSMKTESHMSITDQWFVKHINVSRNFSRDEVQSRCYDSAWELYSVRFERKQTMVDPGVASQNFPRLSITAIKRQKPVNVIINTTHKKIL